MIIIQNETEMIEFARDYGQKIAKTFRTPEISAKVIELTGDVGTGKTTFTSGLAQGLGVTKPLSSPSFNISKIYPLPNNHNLVHYDFYRIPDPGLMRDELSETLSDPYKIIVVEWADTVQDLLPPDRLIIKFSYLDPQNLPASASPAFPTHPTSPDSSPSWSPDPSSPDSSSPRGLEFIYPDPVSYNSSANNIIKP